MEYLLKASVIILIFYTCYKLFLQRETFFESNRWFLLIGILMSLFIPLIIIPIYIEYVPITQNFMVIDDTMTTHTVTQNSLSINEILVSIYGIGVLLFSLKLGIELTSLSALLKKYKPYKKEGYTFIETHENVLPFSFFRYIVYNKSQFNASELDHIINHEKVHAQQFHSFDILLTQIVSTFFWFNPFIWLYKKEIQQNLEFIADKKAQTISNCEKSYQTLLLKASLPNYQFVLANNFYNSLIKKRIVMLHKSKSNTLNVWKYALVLPVLAFFLMSANTKEIYIEKATNAEKSAISADPSVENNYNNLLNSSENINKVSESSGKSIQSNNNSSKISQDPKAPKASKNVEVAVIHKDFTDADLESIKNQLSKKGITVKIKGVKRNSNNEITAIKIDVSSKNSNANYHTQSDNPIKSIKIKVSDDQISIGNSDNIHHADHDFSFISKDGKHKVHTTSKADNVFVFSGDDDDEKIVIRNSDKIHSSPKAKGKVHFVSEDGNVTAIAGEHVVIREHTSGEMDTFKIKKMPKGKSVWVSKDNDNKVYKIKDKAVIAHGSNLDSFQVKKLAKGKAVWINDEGKSDVIAIENGDDNKFFISTGEGKEPLYYLNGKEITKKEMNALDSNSIEKVEVLKGDSATEKYGDKGKNGVVLITTKDKK